MSEGVWERHANPWSVWTRFAALPLLITAVWSRAWLGWWSVPLIALALVWIWLNPRVFPRPASTDNWASKGVLGERVWLNRKRVPIPRHHERILRVINCATAFGALVLVYGLIVLDGSATLIGMVVVFLGKSWFLDRMVWLYEDMREQHRGYETWLY